MNLLAAAIATSLLGLAVGMTSPAAHAASVAASGAGFCSGTLPAYQTQLRARPLALMNEGATSAFVSCSFDMGYQNLGGNDIVAFLVNKTTNPVDVTCTGVDGIDPTLAAAVGSLVPAYVTKTVTLPANSAAPVIFFTADFGVTALSPFNSLSCNLPVGTGIALAGKDYSDTAPPASVRNPR